MIPGVGKDARIEELSDGVTQAALPYRFDDLGPLALFRAAQVMAEGRAKYGSPEENFWRIGSVEHVNHAISHLYAWLAGDETDDHLAHAVCRVIGALEVILQAKQLETHMENAAKRLNTVGSAATVAQSTPPDRMSFSPDLAVAIRRANVQ